MRVKLSLFILMLIMLSTSLGSYVQGNSDQRFDCVYILQLLWLSLKDLNQIRKVNETIIPYLLNVTPAIPTELVGLYNRSISQLYSLSLVIMTLYYGQELMPRDRITIILNTLQEELLNNLNALAVKLVSCSHDLLLASTYRTKISSELEKLFLSTIPHVVNKSLSRIIINPSTFIGEVKDEYRPGDIIEFKMITSGKRDEVVVVSWPTLRTILRLTPEVVDDEVFIRFQVPNLTEVRLLGIPIVRIGGGYYSKLAIILREDNIIKAALPVSVKYEPPHLTIECPQKVVFGEPLIIRIDSADYYNATFVVEGKPILNITIAPSTNIYMLEPDMFNNSMRTVSVLLKVFEGGKNIGQEYLCRILVEPPVAVQIVIPDLALTLSGNVEAMVLTVNMLSSDHTLLIRAGRYEKSIVSNHCTEGCLLRISSGFIPLASLKIQTFLVIEGISILIYEKEVVIINISTFLLMALFMILSFPLLSWLETSIILSLPRLPRGVKPRRKSAEDKHFTGLTRVKSRIALLYLKVLKKLRMPLPAPAETFREHFIRVVLPLKLRDILWRMLRLVEQDLYSMSKPSYEEALKLFRKVGEYEK